MGHSWRAVLYVALLRGVFSERVRGSAARQPPLAPFGQQKVLRSAGCGKSTTLPFGVPAQQELHDLPETANPPPGGSAGEGRTYLITLPKGYDSNRAYPLIMGLHAYGTAGYGMATVDGATKWAEEGKAIVVHPDASGDVPPVDGQDFPLRAWNAVGSSAKDGNLATCDAAWVPPLIHRRCYTSCGPHCPSCSWASCVDDITFISRLLGTIEGQLCVDLSKIRAHGLSNGAMMIFQILQTPALAARFDALVAVAGSPLRGMQQLPETTSVRFLGVWGQDDTVVPIDEDLASQEGLYFASASNTTRTIASHLGCTAAVIPVVSAQMECLAFPGCPKTSGHPVEVASCAFSGGHGWPDGLSDIVDSFYEKGIAWPAASPTSLATKTASESETWAAWMHAVQAKSFVKKRASQRLAGYPSSEV